MSLSEEQKRIKREEYRRRWHDAVEAFEKEGLPLDELNDFPIQQAAAMAAATRIGRKTEYIFGFYHGAICTHWQFWGLHRDRW